MVSSANIKAPLVVSSVMCEPRVKKMSKHDPLVVRVQAGEEAAFKELFLTYRDTVHRVVFRVMGHSPELEDVVQDVFVHVFRSISKFRGDSKFSTWLYRLAVNVTKMHLRKKRSRPRFVDVELPEKPRGGVGPARPDHLVERQVRIRSLYALVENLSEKKRTVLVLHDFQGMSAKDIAEVVEAPVLTVRTRLFYARRELYAAIAEDPQLSVLVEHLLEELPRKKKARDSESPSPAVESDTP